MPRSPVRPTIFPAPAPNVISVHVRGKEGVDSTVQHASRKNPPQVGLRFVFQDVSYNRGAQFGKPAGAAIGRSEGVCTLIAVTKKPQAQCLITAHVPNGQIVIAGEGDPGAKVTQYAIVGGVGAYANARGSVTATALSDTKSLIVIHLTN
jgi:hypothetical protein